MYKITFYVPVTHVEQVKQAMFEAGAGRVGNYDCCAWQVLGVGQFRPLAGATPFIGQCEQIEHLAEYKVDMVCEEHCLMTVVQALKQAHPYEEVAYDVIQTIDV